MQTSDFNSTAKAAAKEASDALLVSYLFTFSDPVFHTSPIPHLFKNHHQHDKNEYANANTLSETRSLIPHNSDIPYIE